MTMTNSDWSHVQRDLNTCFWYPWDGLSGAYAAGQQRLQDIRQCLLADACLECLLQVQVFLHKSQQHSRPVVPQRTS